MCRPTGRFVRGVYPSLACWLNFITISVRQKTPVQSCRCTHLGTNLYTVFALVAPFDGVGGWAVTAFNDRISDEFLTSPLRDEDVVELNVLVTHIQCNSPARQCRVRHLDYCRAVVDNRDLTPDKDHLQMVRDIRIHACYGRHLQDCQAG
jgi:hypothetical protein